MERAHALLYPADMSDAEIWSDLSLDKPGKMLYTGTGGDTSSNGNGYEQRFTFDGVEAGQYKLVLNKSGGQFVPRIVPVDLGEDELDLGNLSLNPLGDVSGDGKVNVRDVAMAQAFVRGNMVLDEYSKACADFNGDGKVNVRDVAQLHQAVRNS